MGQVLHGCAATTEAIGRAIQRSEASVRALARRHGISATTVQKWRKRDTTADARMGPKQLSSSVLTVEQEAMIVACRRHTLLPLDDCLHAVQATIPGLTRSSLHRCLQRHGLSRLPDPEGRAGTEAVQGLSEHRLTKPYHPWTNGQVERMNRTLKQATVRRDHYATHDALRAHLKLFVEAYNYGRRLKALRALTPYEAVGQSWTKQPDRFTINPPNHTPGLNTPPRGSAPSRFCLGRRGTA